MIDRLPLNLYSLRGAFGLLDMESPIDRIVFQPRIQKSLDKSLTKSGPQTIWPSAVAGWVNPATTSQPHRTHPQARMLKNHFPLE
jgi:hypothetical protein